MLNIIFSTKKLYVSSALDDSGGRVENGHEVDDEVFVHGHVGGVNNPINFRRILNPIIINFNNFFFKFWPRGDCKIFLIIFQSFNFILQKYDNMAGEGPGGFFEHLFIFNTPLIFNLNLFIDQFFKEIVEFEAKHSYLLLILLV